MRLFPRSLLVAGVLALAPSAAHAGVDFNGQRLNGQRLNGQRLNGQRLNGQRLNGASLHGVDTSGAALGKFELDGSTIVGSYADAPDSTCAHSELVTGAPLAPGCSKCVEIVQSASTWCDDRWDWWVCPLAANYFCSFDTDDLIGASLIAETETGEVFDLRIDSVQTVPDPTPLWAYKLHDGGRISVVNISDNENDDVLMYEVTYRDPETDTWQPICDYTDRDGYYNRALAVDGIWKDCEGESGCGGRTDEAGWVFACRDVGAIAKCVERFGYKPWQEIEVCTNGFPEERCRTETLADHHRACVRMVRADYCGDGVAHTVDGTRINVWDLDLWTGEPFAQEIDTTIAYWGFEAAWDPDGALCIADERFHGPDPAGTGGTIADYILDTNTTDAYKGCPLRYDQLVGTSADCLSGHNWNVFQWDRGAYMKNESSSLLELAIGGGFGVELGKMAPP